MKDFVITAKNNPKTKEIKGLMTSSKDRKNSGLFVLEGVRLCLDAVKSGCEIVSVFCTENCAEKYQDNISELKNEVFFNSDVRKKTEILEYVFYSSYIIFKLFF